MFVAGSVAGAKERLAMNFLLDRDEAAWSSELARLKSSVGACDTNSPVEPTGALSGEFIWRCAHGRLSGSLTLAPTRPARIQEWALERIEP